jgi:mannose-6-phosphate isomerase-like protein (cupin superfamily)
MSVDTTTADVIPSPAQEDPPEQPGPRERKVQTYRYERPEVTTPKGIFKLAQTDLVKGAVQIVRQGGQNNLHSHAGADTFWLVLKGRARFYSSDEDVIAEFGVHEGIVTPRGTPYWFESADPNEDLELLQVAAYEKGVKDIRTNHSPRVRNRIKETQRFSGRVR